MPSFNNYIAPKAATGIQSGGTGSGAIASGAVQGFFGSTRNIASGTVGVFDFGSGAVIAGTVGSGAVQSGNVASGQISTLHFASGSEIANAQGIVLDFSGLITGEMISGVRAVATQSGFLWIAMASVSGRMPALGILFNNIASGVAVSGPGCYLAGSVQLTSGMSYFPKPNSIVFVGRSGQLASASGSWNSGGFLSGDLGQILGTSLNSGGLVFNVYMQAYSGGSQGLANVGGIPPLG